MTRRRIAEGVLWLLTLAAGAGAIISWRAETALGSAAGYASRTATALVNGRLRHSIDSTRSASRFVAANNPFRLDRRPAAVPYGYQPPPPEEPSREESRTALSVHGILGSAGEWEAILAGLPGREASMLVRLNDTIGDFTVQRLTADTVVIAGRDSLWILTVRPVWK
jgi:hypothetical protein